MKSTAKIEFFEFSLNFKDDSHKTFRQFMLDIGKSSKKDSDAQIFGDLYKYFMEGPNKVFSNNKKTFTVVPNPKINKYWDYRPLPDNKECTISGVVNGGDFGFDRIVSPMSNNNKAQTLDSSQSILDYFYIFVYLPLDYDRGLIIVHSKGTQSISALMRKYIKSIFSNTVLGYSEPSIVKYCPKKIQEDFRKGATITGLTFRKSIPSLDLSSDSIKDELQEYDIKIEAIPKSKDISIDKAPSIVQKLRQYLFGTKQQEYKLSEFDTKMSTRNSDTHVNKTFEWDLRDKDFAPVVYLEGKVALDDDGNPIFAALDDYCKALFHSIKKEFRNEDVVKPID